jgi:hypothetical protein
VILTGSRVWWKGVRSFCLVFLMLALLLLAALGRLVVIDSADRAEALWLWAWQKGRIIFTNSVTGRPVEISFQVLWYFSQFSVRTDAGTEEYYTGGVYRWGPGLAQESNKKLQYCSEVGITMILGARAFRAQGGCLTASLLWPI